MAQLNPPVFSDWMSAFLEENVRPYVNSLRADFQYEYLRIYEAWASDPIHDQEVYATDKCWRMVELAELYLKEIASSYQRRILIKAIRSIPLSVMASICVEMEFEPVVRYIRDATIAAWLYAQPTPDGMSITEGATNQLHISPLRALKFARQATKPFIELAKRQPELTPIAILCVASLPSRYERKQHFDVDVYIVVDKPKVRFEAELSTTNDRVSSKPLTLYEIKPTIELITVSQLLKKSNITNKRFYIYTDYKPRKHSGVNLLQNWLEGNNLSKAAVKRKVPMLANIAVDVAWAID